MRGTRASGLPLLLLLALAPTAAAAGSEAASGGGLVNTVIHFGAPVLAFSIFFAVYRVKMRPGVTEETALAAALPTAFCARCGTPDAGGAFCGGCGHAKGGDAA